MKFISMAAACVCAVATSVVQAADPAPAAPDSLAEAIRQGQSLSGLRLRDERVEQDGKTETANALSLRTLLGWQTAPLHGLSVGAQLIHVGVFDNDYDNGDKGAVQPGRAAYPRIADPDYTGVNQLYVDWTGLPDTRLRLGRQSVKLDNVRFVGNVEFRQVMQVFDGVSVESRALLPMTTIFAAHFNQVIQVSTLRQDADINLINIRHAISPTENLVGYGYFVGWDRTSLQATSTRTLGARLDGARALPADWKLLYTAEYAKQDPYRDGAAGIDSHYLKLGAGAQYGVWYARIDREVLSSHHGQSAFQTPLGTNHLFQGWVDKFLITPNAGIRDTFVTAGGKLGAVVLQTEYHWIDSDVRFASGAGTGSRYGTEWNLSAAYTVRKGWVGKIEYGSFREKDPYTATATSRVRDTDKLWVTMQYSF